MRKGTRRRVVGSGRTLQNLIRKRDKVSRASRKSKKRGRKKTDLVLILCPFRRIAPCSSSSRVRLSLREKKEGEKTNLVAQVLKSVLTYRHPSLVLGYIGWSHVVVFGFCWELKSRSRQSQFEEGKRLVKTEAYFDSHEIPLGSDDG